jgi:hypothetical protein
MRASRAARERTRTHVIRCWSMYEAGSMTECGNATEMCEESCCRMTFSGPEVCAATVRGGRGRGAEAESTCCMTTSRALRERVRTRLLRSSTMSDWKQYVKKKREVKGRNEGQKKTAKKKNTHVAGCGIKWEKHSGGESVPRTETSARNRKASSGVEQLQLHPDSADRRSAPTMKHLDCDAVTYSVVFYTL